MTRPMSLVGPWVSPPAAPYTGGVPDHEVTVADAPVREFSAEELAENVRPTRDDDTVIIAGGRRATLAEFQAYVAADAASRTTDG